MLWEYIKERTLQHPKHRIYDCADSRTFAGLIEDAEDLGKKLTGQKYGILCKSDILTAQALLACMAAKVTAVLLSNRYKGALNGRIIKAMGLHAILTDEGGRLNVQRVGSDSGIEKELEDVAWILSTSGTTGTPKGVMLTRENILCNLQDSDRFFLSSSRDKILAGRGFFHCSSLTGELMMSLLRGVDIYCYPGGFQPHQLLVEMERENITVYSGTPTVFYYLCQKIKKHPGSVQLHYCNVGGEMMTHQSMQQIRQALKNTHVIHSYGMTETCSRATVLHIGEEGMEVNCVGHTIPSLKAMIVDKQGNPLGRNQRGELYLSGKTVMKGYYHDEKASRRVLQDGWLKTGDIGWLDHNDMIHICGRKDDMIIRAGINIYPQEIEQVLRSQNGIKDAKVYSEQGDMGVHRLTAAIVLQEGFFLSQKELYDVCKQSLPRHQLPDEIRLVEKLELSQAGKIRRQ